MQIYAVSLCPLLFSLLAVCAYVCVCVCICMWACVCMCARVCSLSVFIGHRKKVTVLLVFGKRRTMLYIAASTVLVHPFSLFIAFTVAHSHAYTVCHICLPLFSVSFSFPHPPSQPSSVHLFISCQVSHVFLRASSFQLKVCVHWEWVGIWQNCTDLHFNVALNHTNLYFKNFIDKKMFI